ncbi:MAG: SDR family NAD(P)-dependent oxidoreductase [Anaerolineales bacterium]|nr:SDR family NAD(P)-dependent oxidoreductase [Anaerolineales bacterium]MCB8953685.1 SDR family NAD(P)-dependent oxidoreductase [Ardenticatenales bacterium]
MNVNEKIIVITGASSGIGAAAAQLLARKGGRVVLLARREAQLAEVAQSIRAQGGQAAIYPIDLTNAAATSYVARVIMADIGVPDVLVNNAGAGRWLTVAETSPEEGAQMMAAPYFAAFNITRAFLPAMLQRDAGHILNVTSVASYAAWPGATGYIAARFAMRGFSEGLRADLHRTRIGVTLFAAAKVDTPYFARNPGSEERIPRLSRIVPTLTEAQAAAHIARAIERERREVVVPFMANLFLRWHRVFPRMVGGLLTRTGWQGE